MKFKHVPNMVICPKCNHLMVDSYLDEHIYCCNVNCELYEVKYALPEVELYEIRRSESPSS